MPSSPITSDDPFISRISDLLYRLMNLLDRNCNPRQEARPNFHTFIKRTAIILALFRDYYIDNITDNKIRIKKYIRT